MIASDHPPMEEERIYAPNVGMHPNKRCAPWVGKKVHVVWQHPIFDVVGSIKTRDGKENVHSVRWFGFVKELDRHIPAEELKPLPKTHKKELI